MPPWVTKLRVLLMPLPLVLRRYQEHGIGGEWFHYIQKLLEVHHSRRAPNVSASHARSIKASCTGRQRRSVAAIIIASRTCR